MSERRGARGEVAVVEGRLAVRIIELLKTEGKEGEFE